VNRMNSARSLLLTCRKVREMNALMEVWSLDSETQGDGKCKENSEGQILGKGLDDDKMN